MATNSDHLFPVSLEEFKKSTFYEELVDKMHKNIARGNLELLQQYNSDYWREKTLQQYYESFYLQPSIRETCPIRFKPMPRKLKERFLQLAKPISAADKMSVCKPSVIKRVIQTEGNTNERMPEDDEEPHEDDIAISTSKIYPGNRLGESSDSQSRQIPAKHGQDLTTYEQMPNPAKRSASKNFTSHHIPIPAKRLKMKQHEATPSQQKAPPQNQKSLKPKSRFVEIYKQAHLCPVTIQQFKKYTNITTLARDWCQQIYGSPNANLHHCTKRFYLFYYLKTCHRFNHPLNKLHILPNCPEDLKNKIMEIPKLELNENKQSDLPVEEHMTENNNNNDKKPSDCCDAKNVNARTFMYSNDVPAKDATESNVSREHGKPKTSKKPSKCTKDTETWINTGKYPSATPLPKQHIQLVSTAKTLEICPDTDQLNKVAFAKSLRLSPSPMVETEKREQHQKGNLPITLPKLSAEEQKMYYDVLKKSVHLCPVTFSQFKKYTNILALISSHCEAKYGNSNKHFNTFTKRAYLDYFLNPQMRRTKPLSDLQVQPYCPESIEKIIIEPPKHLSTENSQEEIQLKWSSEDSVNNNNHTKAPASASASSDCGNIPNNVPAASPMEISETIKTPSNNLPASESLNRCSVTEHENRVEILEHRILTPTCLVSIVPQPLETCYTPSNDCRSCNFPLEEFIRGTNILDFLKETNGADDENVLRKMYIQFIKEDDNIFNIPLNMSTRVYKTLKKYTKFCDNCKSDMQLVPEVAQSSTSSASKPEDDLEDGHAQSIPLCMQTAESSNSCAGDETNLEKEAVSSEQRPVQLFANTEIPQSVAQEFMETEGSTTGAKDVERVAQALEERTAQTIPNTVIGSFTIIPLSVAQQYMESEGIPPVAEAEKDAVTDAPILEESAHTIPQSLAEQYMAEEGANDEENVVEEAAFLEYRTDQRHNINPREEMYTKGARNDAPAQDMEIQYEPELTTGQNVGQEAQHLEKRYQSLINLSAGSDKYRETSKNSIISKQISIEEILEKIHKDKIWYLQFRYDLLTNLYPLCNIKVPMPVSFTMFKNSSYYESSVKQIVCDFCGPEGGLIDVLLQDGEIYDTLLLFYYIRYFTNPKLRIKYPLKLKLRPGSLRSKMLSFVDIDNNQATQQEPCVASMLLTKATTINCLENVKIKDVSVVQPLTIVINQTQVQSNVQPTSVETTEKSLLKYQTKQPNKDKSPNKLNCGPHIQKTITKSSQKQQSGSLLPLPDTTSVSKSLRTTNGSQPSSSLLPSSNCYQQSSNTPPYKNTSSDALIADHPFKEQLPSTSMSSIKDLISTVIAIEGKTPLCSKDQDRVVADEKKSSMISNEEVQIAPAGSSNRDESRTANDELDQRLDQAKEIFFHNFTKTHSLPYIIRMANGLKQRIIASVLDLNLDEFRTLTHIYQGGELYDKAGTLEQMYKYVFKTHLIWPRNLFINLKDMFLLLKIKYIAVPDASTILTHISPKFLHWSDLIKSTNFVECASLHYFKREYQDLDLGDRSMVERACNDYYNRCWILDTWIDGVPILVEHLTNRVLLEENTAALDDTSLREVYIDSESQDMPTVDTRPECTVPHRTDVARERIVSDEPLPESTNYIPNAESGMKVTPAPTPLIPLADDTTFMQMPNTPELHCEGNVAAAETAIREETPKSIQFIDTSNPTSYAVIPNSEPQIDMQTLETQASNYTHDPLHVTSEQNDDSGDISVIFVPTQIKEEDKSDKLLRNLLFVLDDSDEAMQCTRLSDEVVDLDTTVPLNAAIEDDNLPPFQIDFDEHVNPCFPTTSGPKSSGDLLCSGNSGSPLNLGQRLPSSYDSNETQYHSQRPAVDPVRAIKLLDVNLSSSESQSSLHLTPETILPTLSTDDINRCELGEETQSFVPIQNAQRFPSTFEETLPIATNNPTVPSMLHDNKNTKTQSTAVNIRVKTKVQPTKSTRADVVPQKSHALRALPVIAVNTKPPSTAKALQTQNASGNTKLTTSIPTTDANVNSVVSGPQPFVEMSPDFDPGPTSTQISVPHIVALQSQVIPAPITNANHTFVALQSQVIPAPITNANIPETLRVSQELLRDKTLFNNTSLLRAVDHNYTKPPVQDINSGVVGKTNEGSSKTNSAEVPLKTYSRKRVNLSEI